MLTGTQLIILFTAIISIAGFSIASLKDGLLCKPYLIKEKNQWYRFFTSGLIHADWEHLLFNMLTIFLFGQTVENHFLRIKQRKLLLKLKFVSMLMNKYFLHHSTHLKRQFARQIVKRRSKPRFPRYQQ